MKKRRSRRKSPTYASDDASSEGRHGDLNDDAETLHSYGSSRERMEAEDSREKTPTSPENTNPHDNSPINTKPASPPNTNPSKSEIASICSKTPPESSLTESEDVNISSENESGPNQPNPSTIDKPSSDPESINSHKLNAQNRDSSLVVVPHTMTDGLGKISSESALERDKAVNKLNDTISKDGTQDSERTGNLEVGPAVETTDGDHKKEIKLDLADQPEITEFNETSKNIKSQLGPSSVCDSKPADQSHLISRDSVVLVSVISQNSRFPDESDLPGKSLQVKHQQEASVSPSSPHPMVNTQETPVQSEAENTPVSDASKRIILTGIYSGSRYEKVFGCPPSVGILLLGFRNWLR